MNKKIIAAVLCSILILSGCAKSTTAYQNNVEKPKKDYISILNNAKQITINEAMISIVKHYDIEVDGETVATIEGKFLNGFGDVFTLKDENGNFLIKESEVKRFGFKATRGAVIQDENNKELGYIGENIFDKLFSIGYTFHFYDKDQHEIGLSDEVNFSLLKEYNYYDTNKNKDYVIHKNFGFTDSYDMTINDKKDIPLYNALLMVCIQDAIQDSQKKKK